MLLMLHPDPKQDDPDTPTVDLQTIANDHDRTFWDFGHDRRRSTRTTFGQNPRQEFELPLQVTCPATSLAYRWLAQDFAAIGWLKTAADSSTNAPGKMHPASGGARESWRPTFGRRECLSRHRRRRSRSR